jgi:hypothetical protein
MRPRMLRALILAAALGLGLGPATATPTPGPRSREPGQVVRVEHRDPDALPSRGLASAPVTIELFFLPTTNAQARLPAYRMIKRLQESHPARIRVIFRVVKRSAQVQLPAAALEAHAQGKFFDFMEELHENRTSSSLSRPDILGVAEKIGMDVPRVASAISDDRYRAVLEANDQRLERITRGHASVPAVLFNTKPPISPLSSMSDADYEREYAAAYERALELIDRGVHPRSLMDAFDALVLRNTQPFVGATGPTDEDITGDAFEHKLASPPLALAGLPSFSNPDAKATLPVVILCRPNDSHCGNSLSQLKKLQRIYPDEVRLVWAPWFEVSGENAASLTLLGDAVLCAEQVGSSPEEPSASPGWRWLEKQLQRASRSRRSAPERLIDDITAEVGVNPQELAACRARMAGATLQWIERARRSGVTRAPALVIGGRIYEGIPDQNVVQQLIEAELAPGVLGELAPAWPRARP